ncbi:NTP transferase domain-containing protein, partial [Pseudoxanthobacter sp.]|uniref:cytidylyltransferase domain-containing protein n=1 Tax=Pseudoxanthobacter sp. TaxID=1925742 RepID=UPI002FE2CA8C
MAGRPLLLIPARMASTRLPGKPLAHIDGVPMIVHVLRRALEADIGPVVVACDDPRVEAAVTQAGGRAVMTRSDHESGSDRIFEALCRVDPEAEFDVIVNVQGDLPTIEPQPIRA